jgi:beta-N-acetylhexosaminidase
MSISAFITGLSGITLTQNERSFMREMNPWGLILFKRNINDKEQVAKLIEEFKNAIGRSNVPVLVDQEGGRVQRLGPPNWPKYPAGAFYARLYDRDPSVGRDAARLGARLIAADLLPLGFTVDCLPLADVPVSNADPVIGDRAYGDTAAKVADLAGAIAAGLHDGGVLPVLKHIPGHGRATADSHERLPVVNADRASLEATDFAAFRPLKALPLGMTAHVVFTAIDPVSPATTSVTMIRDVIRGFIGFDGLLMSDDISMGALSGSIGERTRAAFAAGCDVVLHCNGKLDEMQAVAAATPTLDGAAASRAAAALKARRQPSALDLATARQEFAALLASGGAELAS